MFDNPNQFRVRSLPTSDPRVSLYSISSRYPAIWNLYASSTSSVQTFGRVMDLGWAPSPFAERDRAADIFKLENIEYISAYTMSH